MIGRQSLCSRSRRGRGCGGAITGCGRCSRCCTAAIGCSCRCGSGWILDRSTGRGGRRLRLTHDIHSAERRVYPFDLEAKDTLAIKDLREAFARQQLAIEWQLGEQKLWIVQRLHSVGFIHRILLVDIASLPLHRGQKQTEDALAVQSHIRRHVIDPSDTVARDKR